MFAGVLGRSLPLFLFEISFINVPIMFRRNIFLDRTIFILKITCVFKDLYLVLLKLILIHLPSDTTK